MPNYQRPKRFNAAALALHERLAPQRAAETARRDAHVLGVAQAKTTGDLLRLTQFSWPPPAIYRDGSAPECSPHLAAYAAVLWCRIMTPVGR